MTDDQRPKPVRRYSIEYLIWNVASLDRGQVSDEEVEYFRAHPDQIDEVSSPLVLHRLFLWLGIVIGLILVTLSKVLTVLGVHSVLPQLLGDLLVEIVFETGVALIGAAIVTFMIGIALNQQQASAKRWRKEIRRRIADRR